MARRKTEKDGEGKLYGAFAIHGQRYAKDATVSSTRGDKVEGRIENRVGRSLTEKRAAAQVLSPVWQGAISSVIYSALFLRRDVEITRELIIEGRCKLYFRNAIAMIIAMICRRRARTAKLRRSPPFRVTIRFFVRMYTRYVIGIVFGNSRLNFERFVCCRVGRSSSVICREGIAVVARVKQPRHDNRSS